jgi:hypothetical protein
VSAPPAGPSDKGWRLTRPAPGPADEEVLSQVLLLLGDLRVEAFVTEDPTDSQRAEFGLDKPWRVLRWTMKPDPGSKETGVVEGSLIVGAEVPNGRGSRYARLGSSEIVFKLSADQLLIFNAEWRERKVIRVEPTSIRGLRIEWESLELSASAVDDPVRSRRDLRVNAPLAGLDFDSGRIPQWLAAIGNLQAVRFVQFEGPIAPSTGLTRPRLRISIHRSDAERPITLRIGAASPDGYLFATVADGDEGSVFLLPIAAWAPLLSSPSLSFARPLAMP